MNQIPATRREIQNVPVFLPQARILPISQRQFHVERAFRRLALGPPWSSLRFPHLRDPIPIDTPSEWFQWIDQPMFDHEFTTLRRCVNQQQPFGAEEWQTTIAAALGLESTLRRRGRPLKVSEKKLVPCSFPRS
ncbi:MAG TPA: hypothetical protein VK901_18720 [Nitrospiraceae bacterium]|nr:hypothetical protein [Nitrospiraceae bacterium]